MRWGVLDHRLGEDLIEYFIHFLVHGLLVATLLVGSLDVELRLYGLRSRISALILLTASQIIGTILRAAFSVM